MPRKPARIAPKKTRAVPDMPALVAAYVAACNARIDASGDDEKTRRLARPRPRKPATRAEIAALERAWGRTLPPSYRAFLEVCNGIASPLASHRIVGTGDQKWAARQVRAMAQYWDDTKFDPEAAFPVAVPEAGSGIHDFAAFARGDRTELEVVDWDRGRALERHATFAAYLASLVEIERALAKDAARGRRAPRPAAQPAAPFDALFTLEDAGAIRTAIDKLVAARPKPAELETYFDRLDAELDKKRPAALLHAELLFHPKLAVGKPLREAWARTANNAIARLFQEKDRKRSERWADVARPHVRDSAYLGHNLACAYVAVGRLDDALAMCKAAVAAGYPRLAQMRTDRDLGPLLRDPRFQALFGPADTVASTGRTSIPRDAALEQEVAADKAVAKYGAWLAKQGSPLGELVAADLAAAAKGGAARNEAKRRFAAYKKDVLDPAFPALAKHMAHVLDGRYVGFRYGFLEQLDTYELGTPKERADALALLADPHGMFVRRVTLRKAKLDSFELFARLPALRQIQTRWTDITQVGSLAPLAGLAHLRALNIESSKVRDLSPLAKLPIIQLLCDNTAVEDLSPLARHPTLSHISLKGTKVRDLSPLLTCPKLCCVDLWDVKRPKPELEQLERYVASAKNDTVNDDALIDGYRRGVSHPDL